MTQQRAAAEQRPVCRQSLYIVSFGLLGCRSVSKPYS